MLFIFGTQKKSQTLFVGLKKKLSFILLSKMQELIYNRTGAFPGHSPAADFS